MQIPQKFINWLVILFAAALILIWWLYKDGNPEDYRYTIATVTSIEAMLDGGPAANISYSVNGKLYKGWVYSSRDDRDLKKGDKIFFMFYIYNPDRGRVASTIVSDTIKVIPENGWKKLPQ